MMKTLLLVFTYSGLHVLSTNMFREYHYVNSPKTWFEARKFCRETYTDLAAVTNQDENKRLWLAMQGPGKFAWIGLYDDLNSWRWTMGNKYFNGSTDYNNWKLGQPVVRNANESCLVISRIGLWRDEFCDTEYPLVCFYEQGSPTYILVETLMTWHDAKSYCTSKYTDLVSVTNQSENEEIYKMLSRASWVGLHRKLWSSWSDQSPATFTTWMQGQPDSSGSGVISCAAVNTSTGTWLNIDCNMEQEFICEKVIPSMRFKLRLQSETDLNDPTIQQQILKQLQDKLENEGLSDFRIYWVPTKGETIKKEQKMTQGLGT